MPGNEADLALKPIEYPKRFIFYANAQLRQKRCLCRGNENKRVPISNVEVVQEGFFRQVLRYLGQVRSTFLSEFSRCRCAFPCNYDSLAILIRIVLVWWFYNDKQKTGEEQFAFFLAFGQALPIGWWNSPNRERTL